MTRVTHSEAFVECMVTQELGDPFRPDTLKKPQRALAKYKDFSVA